METNGCILFELTSGDHILDLACGTCDIGYQIYKMQAQAHVFAVDPNQEMLTRGRARLLDAGIYQNIHFCLSFAEQLPFPDKRMHDAICAFGFRNFTNPQQALNNLYRILKPGGRAIILEFSRPQAQIIAQGYQHYAKILPTIGERIADGRENYQYLVDSIETHMSADELSAQLAQAEF